MREFLTVLAYTFRENIRKTAFILSTIIILIITMAVMIVPALVTNFNNSNQNKDVDAKKNTTIKNFYIIDSTDVLSKDAALLQKAFVEYKFELKPESEKDKLVKSIKENENMFLLVINEQSGILNMEYFVKKYGAGPSPEELKSMVKDQYNAKLLNLAKVDSITTAKFMSPPVILVQELGQGYVKSMISSMIIIFILFFAIYFFGYGIAISVASEKTSRVMETLITSTKPSSIIFGKTAAMGLLGLLQLTLILSTAAITYKLFFPANFKMFGQNLDFSAFTPLALIMIIIYFVLGYLLYAMLNAVAGASVSRSEDVNSAIMPISMISLIAFYAAYFPATMPNAGKMNTITSIIPFTSPFSMPGRLLMGTVTTTELATSISLLIATILLFSWISVKIYSAAILHYGSRLRIIDFVRMMGKKSKG